MDPEDLIELYVHRAVSLVSLRDTRGRLATKELLADLIQADKALSARLEALGGAFHTKFTAAQAKAYQVQIQLSVEVIKKRLAGVTEREVIRAIGSGYTHASGMIARLEKAFSGVAAPMRIQEAHHMSRITSGIESSLLLQSGPSIMRYGDTMIREFEKTMRMGILKGQTTREITQAMVAHGGPGGIFRKKKWMAERIVRTEVADAYSASKHETMLETRRLDAPDLQKKIMAVFDKRTAFDSYAVHGQIRDLDDSFEDGAGRRYLRPPARPNDRETTMPWRPHWKDSDLSRMKSSKEVESAWRVEKATKDRAETAKRAAQVRRDQVRRRRQQREMQKSLRELAG